MKLETKFKVGETVYFISDNVLNKGVITEIIINVRGFSSDKFSYIISERYEVEYLDRDYERVRADIDADSLFENAKGVVEKLMKDFEKSEKDSDLNDE